MTLAIAVTEVLDGLGFRHPAKPPHQQWMHGKKGTGKAATVALSTVVDKAAAGPAMSDLLNGDDASRDARLRAVFEGTFGLLRTKVTKTGGGDGKAWVEGDIVDRRGRKVGNFSRSFGRENGELYALHQVIEIDRKVQGSGFASAFNGNAIDWYRKSGVEGVYLRANADIGGYAWASQGFDFATQPSAEFILNELRDTVTALRAGKSKNRFGETIPRKLRNAKDLGAQLAAAEALLARADRSRFGEPNYPTAYEISQLGRRNGASRSDTWIGKGTMLGSSWDGVLRLKAPGA